MLALVPGLIAGSTLTTSTNQVPNVATQVSIAFCGYRSGWWSDLGQFGTCMAATIIPARFIFSYIRDMARDQIERGDRVIQSGTRVNDKTIIELGKSLLRSGARLALYTQYGFIAVAL